MDLVYSPGVYRSNDSIKNFKFRLKLISLDTEISEEQNLDPESGAKVLFDEEIAWQDKLFSEIEWSTMNERFDDSQETKTKNEALHKQRFTELKQLHWEPGHVYTLVDNDPVTKKLNDDRGFVSKSTTNGDHLAKGDCEEDFPNEAVSHEQNEQLLMFRGKQAEAHKKAIEPVADIVKGPLKLVDNAPSFEESKFEFVDKAVTTMYIVADLSKCLPRELTTRPQGDSEKIEGALPRHHYPLCCIRYAQGVLFTDPDFFSKEPYKIDIGRGIKNVYKYSMEHASRRINKLEFYRNKRLTTELLNRNAAQLSLKVGDAFGMPFKSNTLRLFILGEIVSALNFEYDHIYIEYLIELPRNWTVHENAVLGGVTPTCDYKEVGADRIAHYGVPFEFDLFYDNEFSNPGERDELPRWPNLMFAVYSMDSYQRYRCEGYCYMPLPFSPGITEHSIRCWRPIGNDITSSLRRYFIGGSPELCDFSFLGVPDSGQKNKLSKYGCRTQTTGTINVKLNIVHQSQAFIDTAQRKPKLRHTATAKYVTVTDVLEAFKRAHDRMLNERQNVQKALKFWTLSIK